MLAVCQMPIKLSRLRFISWNVLAHLFSAASYTCDWSFRSCRRGRRGWDICQLHLKPFVTCQWNWFLANCKINPIQTLWQGLHTHTHAQLLLLSVQANSGNREKLKYCRLFSTKEEIWLFFCNMIVCSSVCPRLHSGNQCTPLYGQPFLWWVVVYQYTFKKAT